MHGVEGNMLTILLKIKTGFNILLLSASLLVSLSSCAGGMTDKDVNTPNIHHVWNELVAKNVVVINNGHSTEVDYAAMKLQHSELQVYLASLSAVTLDDFERFSKPKQLAFLINAYNAWTVDLILTEYPNIESIKDLGSFFKSPWNKDFIPLFGEIISLNNIEHDLIRGSEDSDGEPKYNEPRIHFAVNCASIGCPALRNEAYTAEKLEQQLEEQTIHFLSDKTRNTVKKDELYLSSIFKWYEEDFEQGFRETYSLSEFILLYSDAMTLSPAHILALKDDDMDIEFLSYNWELNAHH